ncbi:hypothetical protein C0Q70_11245 [Pomacea canaliculata]|uniref:Uncharacterized protein n=1 Tax=Pomacea canaliculata TaxID=400727 RepID=A0A2T7P5G3_POMCA|nr:hypothetical protein C0Q70_11245 [Pomacea canaliculata]
MKINKQTGTAGDLVMLRRTSSLPVDRQSKTVSPRFLGWLVIRQVSTDHSKHPTGRFTYSLLSPLMCVKASRRTVMMTDFRAFVWPRFGLLHVFAEVSRYQSARRWSLSAARLMILPGHATVGCAKLLSSPPAR